MLYVHSLMGDGAPGEVDPGALTPASRSIYAQDPARREALRRARTASGRRCPTSSIAGRAAEVDGRGARRRRPRACPDVDVDARRDRRERRCPRRSSTGDGGTATVTLTPTDPSARAHARASARPGSPADVAGALRPDAARAGAQRAAARRAGAATPRASRRAPPVQGARRRSSTQISAQSAAPGAAITDTVQGQRPRRPDRDGPGRALRPVPGAATRSPAPTRRSGPARFDADRRRRLRRPRRSRSRVPGYYTYRESIAESDRPSRACRPRARTRRRRRSCAARPRSRRRSARRQTAPGAQITDTAVVTGLGKLAATVNVELWGPFADARRDPLRGHAVLDRHVRRRTATAPTRPRRSRCRPAGYYTYRESIAATDGLRRRHHRVRRGGGDDASRRPRRQVTTIVSDARRSSPGGSSSTGSRSPGSARRRRRSRSSCSARSRRAPTIDCDGAPVLERRRVDVAGRRRVPLAAR